MEIERETDRQIDKQTDIDREKDRQTDTDRERENFLEARSS
jgi:hypothetical protein